MSLPESPKEIIEDTVTKIEDVACELTETVKNVEGMTNLVERVPRVLNMVEVIDNELAGSVWTCGLFGWTLSASRLRRSPAKSAVLSSEAPK